MRFYPTVITFAIADPIKAAAVDHDWGHERFDPIYLATVCRRLAGSSTHSVRHIGERRAIAALVRKAGYLEERAFISADPGCVILSKGLDSPEMIIFKATVKPDIAGGGHREGELVASLRDDNAARTVYNQLMGSVITNCSSIDASRQTAVKVDCLKAIQSVWLNSNVAMALFLKFAFMGLNNTRAATIFDLVASGRLVHETELALMTPTPVALLKGMAKRDLATIYERLIGATPGGSSVDRMVHAITTNPS